MRHSENKRLVRNVRSAIRIQAIYRGYRGRQQLIPIVDAILKEVSEEVRRKSRSSTHIQAIVRGYLCRIRYHRLIIRQPSLKVFQASPLAYALGTKWKPFPYKINLDLEQKGIRQALKASNVSCEFDNGFIPHLQEVLVKDEYEALQISCHGKEQYLMLENGWGQMVALATANLKKIVEFSAPKRLQLVVVAVSRPDSIAKAVAEAGIPHVISCARGFEENGDDATVLFTSSLYRSLASGMTIQRAFDLACLQLSADPRYLHLEYSLLPENGNHDVAIFPRRPTAGSLLPTSSPPPSHFPDLPSDFFYPTVSDDLDACGDLDACVQAVRRSRLTRVKGPAQIGKSTLVTECCHYLKHRLKVIDIDMILWKSVHEQSQANTSRIDDDHIDDDFGALCEHWRNDSSPCSTSAIRQYGLSVIGFFKDRRSLLVIDAKRLPESGTHKLNKFLRELIKGTKHLKVVVICGANDCYAGDIGDICVATDIIVNGLSMTSTLRLFAKYCDHVDDGDELRRHLLPKGHGTASLSKRHSKILKMLGGKNPMNVFCAARTMTRDQYDTLRELGSYDSPDLLNTRAELLLLNFEFKRRIDFRVSKDDTASWLEKKHKAVTCLLEEFQDAQALSSVWKLQFEELLKGENQSDETWSLLHQKLKNTQAVVEKEKDAIISWLVDSHSSLFSTRIRNGDIVVADKLVFTTGSSHQDSARHSSEAFDLVVSKDILESKYGVMACAEKLRKKYNDFLLHQKIKNAESIEIHLRLLEDLNYLYLSRSDLRTYSSRLKGMMDNFVASSRLVRLKASDALCNVLDDAICRESKAETSGPLDINCGSRAIKIVAASSPTEVQQRPQSSNDDIMLKLHSKREKAFNQIDNLLEIIMGLKKSNSRSDETEPNYSMRTLSTASMSDSSSDLFV